MSRLKSRLKITFAMVAFFALHSVLVQLGHSILSGVAAGLFIAVVIRKLEARPSESPAKTRIEWPAPPSIALTFDPIGLLLEVVRDLYPEAHARVQWSSEIIDPDEGLTCGVTEWNDDCSCALVTVSANLPMNVVVAVLGHELAHVAAGQAADHGPEFEAANEAIEAEYTRRVAALCDPETQRLYVAQPPDYDAALEHFRKVMEGDNLAQRLRFVGDPVAFARAGQIMEGLRVVSGLEHKPLVWQVSYRDAVSLGWPEEALQVAGYEPGDLVTFHRERGVLPREDSDA